MSNPNLFALCLPGRVQLPLSFGLRTNSSVYLRSEKKECMDHGSCASGHLDMFLQQIIYSFYKYSPGEKPKTEAQILSRSGKVSKCHDLHMAKPHLT